MIIHGNTLLSLDIFEREFVCNLEKCKGSCCVEGEYGAPLEEEEIKQIEENLDGILPYLPEAAKEVISEHGFYELDPDKDLVTNCVEGRDCVFAIREKDIYMCGMEKAWKEGKSSFRKPVSCHLYPIRIAKVGDYDAVNYNHWNICSPACSLGAKLKVPVYVFLKDALIRKYGTEWYGDLEHIAGEFKEAG